MNRETWEEYFELINGRKATEKEIREALNQGEIILPSHHQEKIEADRQTAGEITSGSFGNYKVDQRGRIISFQQAWKDYWLGAVDFSGYTSPRGALFPVLVIICGAVMTNIMTIGISLRSFSSSGLNSLFFLISGFGILTLFFIIALLPAIASSCRRLRDVGFHDQGIIITLIVNLVLNIISLPGLLLFAFYALNIYLFFIAPADKFVTNQSDHILFRGQH